MPKRYLPLSLPRVFALSAMIGAGGAVMPFSSGCTGGSRVYHMVDPAERRQNGDWSLSVVSDRLIILPVLPDPVHNFLVIFDAEGKKIMELHGAGLGREHLTMQTWPGNQDALYAFVDGDASNFYGGEFNIRTEILVAPPEEVMRKCLIILDAMYFINRQNLKYDMFEWASKGQNSNSVAYTLAKAAGFKIPPQNLDEIEEGHGRLLLPRGWRSYYEDWEPPVEGAEFLHWYMHEMRALLKTETEAIAKMGPPPKGRAKFFDPDAPFATYGPLVVDDVLARWDKHKRNQAASFASAGRTKLITGSVIGLPLEPQDITEDRPRDIAQSQPVPPPALPVGP